MDFWQILAIIFGVLSVITFFMYGVDKFKAQRGKWRISEKALLVSSFIGGAVGGFLAMQLFRHKTKHWYFRYGLPALLTVQLVLLGWLGLRLN